MYKSPNAEHDEAMRQFNQRHDQQVREFNRACLVMGIASGVWIAALVLEFFA